MSKATQFDWAAVRSRLAALGEALSGQALSPDELARRFAARADVLARRGEAEAQDAKARHIVVQAGGERCALPLADAAGVVKIETLARLPGTPDELVGAIAERGRIWPVLELARLLGLKPDTVGPRFALLLARAGRRAALGVAALDGILDDVPETGPAGPSRYARVVAGGLIVIDATAVLDHRLLAREGHS